MSDAKALQKVFYHCQGFSRYEIVAPNIFLGGSGNEMDIMAIRRSGFVDEIEIKISKSDFLADFKKTLPGKYCQETFKKIDILKHDELKKGTLSCNYFSFLMTEELAEKCVIPEYAGLYIYIDKGRFRPYVSEIKKAPRLHSRKITESEKYEIGRKMAYRYWQTI